MPAEDTMPFVARFTRLAERQVVLPLPRRLVPSRAWAALGPAVLIATVAGAVVAIAMTGPGTPPRPNPALGGPEVLLRSNGEGPLTIRSVGASAFSTTIEVVLDTGSPLQDGATVAVEHGAVSAAPAVPDLKLAGVRMAGTSRVELLFAGGPLAIDARSIALTLDAYVVVPPEGGGVRIAGPWVAQADIDGSRPVAAAIPAARGLSTVSAPVGGVGFVIEDAVYDGFVLRLTYRLSGDASGIRMFAAVDPDPQVVTLPLLGPAPAGSAQVEIRLETPLPVVELVFPRLVRTVMEPIRVELAAMGPGEFQGGGMTARGPIRAGASVREGSVVVEVKPVDVGAAGISNAAGPPRLTDDFGSAFAATGAAGAVLTGSGGGDVVFQFTGTVPSTANRLVLELGGYDEIAAPEARLTLPLR